MGGLFQTTVGQFYQGVSRQPPTKRGPNQVETADNFYASVDQGGLSRRPGTALKFWLTRSNYAAGPHLVFKTTDGTRWALLRRASPGQIEVRNFDSGNLATLTSSVPAQNYLNVNGGAGLKYLPIADSVLILNPDQAVAGAESAVPALGVVYFVVRRSSSAAQAFSISRSSGGTASATLAANNTDTRETVAANLRNNAQAAFGSAGCTFTVLGQAPHIIRCSGPTAVLNELACTNSWDGDAIYAIKGRVTRTTDLPPVLEEGEVIAVDPNQGDPNAVYYVRWSRASGAWVETSYLPNDNPTYTFTGSSLPVQLRRTGTATFDLDVCPWVNRLKGDSATNPHPFFAGKKIADMAVWKGRLALACEDTITFSQPDDYFNFWKETGRESRPADVVEIPCDSTDVTVIEHIVPFRNKLIVTSENTQLEVPGDQPLTPESAVVNVATRFNLNRACRPTVVGDALYYAGTAEGRSAVWQYFYDDTSASNTAFDLSKHAPDLVPGKVSKIAGVPQAGRLFAWSDRTRNRLYVHTSYWAENRREQNAWTTVSLAPGHNILDFYSQDDSLLLLVENTSGNALFGVAMSGDAQTTVRNAAVPLPLPYLDQLYATTGTYYPGLNRTDFVLPAAMTAATPVVCTYQSGDGWWREHEGTVASGILSVSGNVTGSAETWLGVRTQASVTFSPFYARDEQGLALTQGRYQVRSVGVELAVTGDFSAFVARADRTPTAQLDRSARVVGQNFVRPVLASNVTYRIPLNARGEAATLTLTADSTAPWSITGYVLTGRYSNPVK